MIDIQRCWFGGACRSLFGVQVMVADTMFQGCTLISNRLPLFAGAVQHAVGVCQVGCAA